MSTRGYICIEHENHRCEGFYNQFDNYPEGTGMVLLTSRGGHTGDITHIQELLDNTNEVITSLNWTDAYAEGNKHGCDWFYVRKGDVWYCMSYYANAIGLVPVAAVIAESVETRWKEDYEYLEKDYNNLRKEQNEMKGK